MNTKYLLLGVAIAGLFLVCGGLVVYKRVVDDQYEGDFSQRASIFAWASRCSVDGLQSWTCGQPCEINKGVQDVKAFYNQTHQIKGYTAYDSLENNIIVAFRATTTNLNWLLDFDYFKIKYPTCVGCEVHRGFLIAWRDLQNSVLKSTIDLVQKYPNATLSVIGHSLGGALAILGAIDIHLSVKAVDFVYTFGQPRVGNKEFAAFFDLNIANSYRLIHDRDLVPHLPLQSQGFYHQGTEVWYNQNSTSYTVCQKYLEDKSCSDKLKSYTMDDHDIYLGRDISADCN
ncbi:hypothetical protein ABPG72_010328 [Tetrahymena utriculariae]